MGALETTNMGLQLPGNPISQDWKKLFIEKIVETMNCRTPLHELTMDIQEKAKERFDLKKILDKWDKVLYG